MWNEIFFKKSLENKKRRGGSGGLVYKYMKYWFGILCLFVVEWVLIGRY